MEVIICLRTNNYIRLSLISNDDMPVEHEIYINDQCCWEICLVYVVDMKKRIPKLAKLRHVNLNSCKVHSTQIIR